MSRELTKFNEKDYKLLKKEGLTLLGENGHLFPTFGNHIEDFVKFCIYDMNETYLKSGVSEDFENDGSNLKLKPGNDLRKAGFTRGDYKVKYFFYRRLAGADEVILTKTVDGEGGIVHSGNPKLTGVPMGEFHVDMNGNVYDGNNPPTDGTRPTELEVKEYKFFIDEISGDRKEVRLAPQEIKLDKYYKEFDSLSNLSGIYTPLKGFGDIMSGGGLYGMGRFSDPDGSVFQFDQKDPQDKGFDGKYLGGLLRVKNAYITGYETGRSSTENPDWSLEEAIPKIEIVCSHTNSPGIVNNTIVFTAVTENGNTAPSWLSYYWDFGCGHKEFTGPQAYHNYTMTGNMPVTLVINSPNFTETATFDDLRIVEANSDEIIPEVQPPTSPYDGRLVTVDVGGGTYYIQSGHKRLTSSNNERKTLAMITGQWDYTDEVLVNLPNLPTSLVSDIPTGPSINLTGPNGITNPNTLTYSIVDNVFVDPVPPPPPPGPWDIVLTADTGGTITTPTENSATYNDGDVIFVKATANNGYNFVGWNSTSNANTFSSPESSESNLTIGGNGTIVAQFAPTGAQMKTITLQGQIFGGDIGSYSFLIDGQELNSKTVPAGTSVQIQAIWIPASGFETTTEFIGWTDDNPFITTNPRTIIMNGNLNITANFGIGM